MPNVLEAEFHIVTPMFLGGADQGAGDGIRPPAVKGALRFWWRAINWGRFRLEAQNDAFALQTMHRKEASLFGLSTDDNSRLGQGCFILCVSEATSRAIPSKARDGHRYMLGQGLINQRSSYLRQAISSGTFTVRLAFKKTVAEEDYQSIAKAMLAWGLLGGLGSRSRRGIGSVVLDSMDFRGVRISLPCIPQTIEDYAKTLLGITGTNLSNLPPLSAVSAHTRIDLSTYGADPWNLVDEVGLEMMRYRGWGFNSGDGVHRISGKTAEQNFPKDHHSILKATQGIAPLVLPERAVFGLPHNYFFKSEFDKLTEEKLTKKWAGVRAKAELAPNGEKRTRRASPLFIHVHSFPDGNAAVIQTLLPAIFLPSTDEVEIKAKRLSHGSASVPGQANWETIHAYLDRFHNRVSLVPVRTTS